MTAGRTHLAEDARARPSTPKTAVLVKLGRFALASLLTLPGTDGTTVLEGPTVRPGRLGTLNVREVRNMAIRGRYVGGVSWLSDMPDDCPSGILWDIFYIYLSLLDSLSFLLILLDEFLDFLWKGVMKCYC